MFSLSNPCRNNFTSPSLFVDPEAITGARVGFYFSIFLALLLDSS
jgi:hypothetical protein